MTDPLTPKGLRGWLVLLARAAATYNIREHGKNKGRAVKAIQGFAGTLSDVPWCCASMDIIYEIGCVLANVPCVLNPGLSCSAFITQAHRLGRTFKSPTQAKPGDFIVLTGGTGPKAADGERYQHIGMIVSVLRPDGYFETVEGNTNAAGSAEGDGVYFKLRNPERTPCTFIRAG